MKKIIKFSFLALLAFGIQSCAKKEKSFSHSKNKNFCSKNTKDHVNSSSEDLIKNGSFEDPILLNNSWNVFNGISGWNTIFGPGIEIQRNVAGRASDGEQFVELDSHSNTVIEQKITIQPCSKYVLKFKYSPRPGIEKNSNGVRVWIDNDIVKTISKSGVEISETDFETYKIKYKTRRNKEARIRFEAIGESDGVGGYIDKIEFYRIS